MREIATCQHDKAAPTHMLKSLHRSQAGTGRHKCTNCAYALGLQTGLSSTVNTAPHEQCYVGSQAPQSLLADLPESQAGSGRHKCTICAYQQGYENGLSQRNVKIEEEISEKIEQLINSGAGFGNPETNKKVERAAVSYVTRWYEEQNWKVISVESEKRGYDLFCSKNSVEEHVEVKGVQGGLPSFIVTTNEKRQAQNNSNFVICIVTSALSPSPNMYRFRGEEFINSYDLSALAYRASPKR
ncbi:MAG: hypothetical protein QOG00_2093 [Pyrinomonadaceae bacterium]|nr:hypothetical protein [Pyrinomonadaceae bacterium]